MSPQDRDGHRLVLQLRADPFRLVLILVEDFVGEQNVQHFQCNL